MQNLPRRKFNLHYIADYLLHHVTRLAACAMLLGLAVMLIYLVQGSWPAIKTFGWHFVISTDWNPVTQKFGALPAIVGTLVTALIALLIAVPISIGIAVFLTELAPSWLEYPLRIAIELLAGIPSIIYGMWGLFVFAPVFANHVEPWLNDKLGNFAFIGALFQGPPLGIGILTAGIILSIMIIPFMASVMRDACAIVPDLLKESAYGLGATTWEVVRQVILPYAKPGVIGGIMLGLGRALGETMAVAFVIGNAHQLTASLLMPGSSISSVLANEFTEATGKLYNAALIELGLLLLIITFIILALGKWLMLYLHHIPHKSS
ncbi:MAG: phosphate ABC transporter permease subunit PstC [Gammaproteobacteria bacterium]